MSGDGYWKSISHSSSFIARLLIKFMELVRSIARTLKIRNFEKDNCYYKPFNIRERSWSNNELKKICHFFEGSVVNVSGWLDQDKDGGYYRHYFPKATSYTVTNFDQDQPGDGKTNDTIYLDLTNDLPESLHKKFDVVFSHTTLEHIFDIFKAFSNLCCMSREIVIVVVPFVQKQHEPSDIAAFYKKNGYVVPNFKDYWRFTPSALRRLFEINGFHTVYEAADNTVNRTNYILFVGARSSDKWQNLLPHYEKLKRVSSWAS